MSDGILHRINSRCIVDETTGCKIWTGTKDHKGYGQISVKNKTQAVHRIAWVATFGLIPKGICVLHRCDTPLCCNVDHLFLGTQLDNIADKVTKGRSAKGDASGPRLHPERMKRGSEHYSAKLTDEDVRSILRDYAEGGVSQRSLADKFGVTQGAICRICNRRSWKHLKEVK